MDLHTQKNEKIRYIMYNLATHSSFEKPGLMTHSYSTYFAFPRYFRFLSIFFLSFFICSAVSIGSSAISISSSKHLNIIFRKKQKKYTLGVH